MTTTDPSLITKLLAVLDDAYAKSRNECNEFVMAATEVVGQFCMPYANADQIVSQMRAGISVYTLIPGATLAERLANVRRISDSGRLVIAGATSSDIRKANPNASHGHVAIVLPLPWVQSSVGLVPQCRDKSHNGTAHRQAGLTKLFRAAVITESLSFGVLGW
ncbi:MAG: hypothetical protein NTV94_17080 [Planctomycetota bacterium]|nr:hypothetical protein [Planctomycetota bacterium]